MTTAAHSLPALEVSAPDENMDVLSDAGFDFGDADIDLDLDTAPSVHDDDMSLNDAATDGGVDMEEPTADQDDFMADHGDLIEEDNMDNEAGGAVVSQPADTSASRYEADMLAPPDEDLIDYSDDEGQQHVKMYSPSGLEQDQGQGQGQDQDRGQEEEVSAPYTDQATSAAVNEHNQEDFSQDDAQPTQPAKTIPQEISTFENIDAGPVEANGASPEQHQTTDAAPQREDLDEDYELADDGGVTLPTDEHSLSDDNHADSDVEAAPEEQTELQRKADDASPSDLRDSLQIELRPVTVNYAGNELWLFKQHDLEESGDYLLEDLSMAKSSISNLFHACRLSLGDDVSDEHEIGFRFDHLHNLELYEDNTACIAVSLERLVDLYHTLQAQDGNENPECFYVTLQFRPRFATLLADVAQYAEQGSGYSALDAAVAAGETHFSNVFSSASTEHENADWDEEIEDEDASTPISVHSIASDRAEAGEHGKQFIGEAETQQEEQDEEQEATFEAYQHGIDSKDEWNQTLSTQDEDSYLVPGTANAHAPPQAPIEHVEPVHETDTAATEQHESDSQDERTPDQIAHDKQEAEDFVDYSDDEDEQEGKSVPAQEASPSSSTVQGDDPTEIQETSIATEHDGEDDRNPPDAGFDENDEEATLLTQTQYGDDANHYAFQDYTETYEQGDPFQDYPADGTEGDSFDASGAYNGDTNQEFADYNFQDLEAEVNLGFDEQSYESTRGEDGNEGFETVEDVSHADAFLDLDNAPEWAVDADPASDLPGEDAILLQGDATVYGDDEGGEDERPAAKTSSAANPAPTLSNDQGTVSPQGQKRSIDEVGDGIDDAPDSIDTKRPRV